MKPPKDERPIWPDGVVELKLSEVTTGRVVFGDTANSFELLQLDRADWERLGGPLALTVFVTKGHGS